jgi:hypothetical protein
VVIEVGVNILILSRVDNHVCLLNSLYYEKHGSAIDLDLFVQVETVRYARFFVCSELNIVNHELLTTQRNNNF